MRASVRRNAVALISLSVALFSTSYNTWRNQATEAHRNVREASFKLLEQAGELQQLMQHRYYGGDHTQMNWIAGWGHATLIRDMAPLVSPAVQTRADANALKPEPAPRFRQANRRQGDDGHHAELD